ncbi:MAG: insulinase family protein [Bacteroidetes bacterium]|nr:insulinase family protein [Bacteroidota bacterium]
MKNIFIRILFAVAVFLTASTWLSGQNYNMKDLPSLDPNVKTGVLDNGMHYYIRVNKLPEKRGEFYIANNIGAIEEDDDQNGLAHFTEHMSFNGTKNFPKKAMLDYLATIGVKFGQNVNAGTGVEQTIFNLSNVPLLRETVLDSALLILHDWAHYVSFEDSEIDLERGVILEEWRMYGSAEERMSNKLAPITYKNSKYAKRDVIGDTAVLKHFKYETIKRFYNKWYRPDLQALVIVGDFDPNLVEAKIKKIFSEIPKTQNPAPKEVYPVPDNKEPLIGTATDKEATNTMIEVNFKHDAISNNDKNLGYMRLQLIRSFINNMFGQRMNELSRSENPPFMFAYSSYGFFTRNKDAFYGYAQVPNNEAIKGLTALLTEMERMKKYGFTAGEFDRAKATIMRNYESRFMDRDKRKNRELVYPVIMNFLMNNPNPGIEFEYPFIKAMIPGISLDEVNNEAKKYVRDDNMIVTVTGPEKEGITVPTEQEIKKVLAAYKSAKIDPYVDNMAGKKLIEKDPVPGKVVKTSANKDLGTTEWVLSNGMRIIFKPTDIKEDELLIKGYSAGGQCLLKDDDLPAADLLGDVVSDMGVGSFSRTDLNKLMAGKKVNVSLYLGDDQDVMNSRTSPKDIETALQLIYLYFTQPRWNETDFKTWLDKQKADYINADAEPRKAFYDTLTVIMSNHSPRSIPMSYKLLDKITFNKVKAIYQDRFSDPGNFTFQFVGKIDPEQVKPLLEKYLASLPGGNRTEAYKDDGVRPPKGKVTKDFQRENKTPRTSVFVNYNGTSPYTFDDKIYGAAIRHVLELRYIEKIREDEGGAYSIRVSYNVRKYPVTGYMMNVSFDTDPVKADKLVGIVHQQIKNMVENGPSETDLQKAKEYFLKQRQEDMKENNWWNNTLTDYYYYDMNNVTGYEDKVKALNVKSVHEYAKKALTQGNIIEVIMRP